MTHLDVIAVGRVREKHITRLCDEYTRRLKRYARINVIEVRDGHGSTVADGLDRDADEILSRLPNNSVSVALDERGDAMSSKKLSQWLSTSATRGQSRFVFIIGGPDGLSDRVRERVDRSLRLSQMTFTHEMARMLLLEQLYRAMSIWRGDPYHRA